MSMTKKKKPKRRKSSVISLKARGNKQKQTAYSVQPNIKRAAATAASLP